MKNQHPHAPTTAPPQQPWTETFGSHLCAMSGDIGLKPEDAGLLVASILGNLSGSRAGVRNSSGRVVSPGANLLFAGDASCRFKRATDELLAPAVGIQEFLRNQALCVPRMAGDMHAFGPQKSMLPQDRGRGKSLERCLKIQQASEDDLESGDCIPHDWERTPGFLEPVDQRDHNYVALKLRVPGVRQRPSFIFQTNDLTRLEQMLAQTFDHRVFTVDTTGGFFQGSFLKSAPSGNTAITRLCSYLCDSDYTPPLIHPNQGRGEFQSARVKFLASITLSRLSEVINRDTGPDKQVVNQSILWAPSWKSLKTCGPDWWKRYHKCTERILNDRIRRAGPIFTLSRDNALEVTRMENALLDACPRQFQEHLGAFSSLVPQLLWAFLMLEDRGQPTWAYKATEVSAMHALAGHVTVLQGAQARVEEQRLAKLKEKVITILAEKGPSTGRELQRSIFKARQSDVALVLDQVAADDTVCYNSSSRLYQLAASTSARGNKASHKV